MGPTDFLLSVDTKGCAVEVAINGVPLFHLEAGRERSVGEIIDPWLAAGTNVIELSSPRASATGPSPGCVELAVLAVPEGGSQASAPKLTQYHGPQNGEASLAQTLRFPGPPEALCQLWQQTSPIDWTDAAKREVTDLVLSLHKAFARRKVGEMVKLTDYRARDTARCLGKPADSGVEEQKRFFELITSAADFAPEPWSETELMLELVGSGKLVWAHRKDDKLLIQNQLGQGMDLYVAQIDGKWQLVR